MSKSYVSMEQKVCVAHAFEYETGAILFDKRLRESMDDHTVTGWGLCPECQARVDEGYVVLVAILNAGQDKLMQPSDALRTGVIAYLKEEKAKELFRVPDHKIVFISEELMTWMTSQQ